MRAAVVVTTYNNPKFLALCLRSFTNQSCADFDLFIADDGSREETRATIDRLRPDFQCAVKHLWHEDQGYRKSEINNEVFRNLREYPVILCVDHDVIVHQKFVEDHLSVHRSEKRVCFMGRRVELGPKITRTIGEDNVCGFNRGFSRALLTSGLSGDSRGMLRGLRIASPFLRRALGRDRVPDLLGSNFSVAAELLFQVNGYNEDYRSYWGEDGDLFIRLRNSGARLLGSKSIAIQYHLDHPRLDPDQVSQQRYQELLKDASYRRCRNGIVKE